MAFIDFSEGTRQLAAPAGASRLSSKPLFSPLEQQVIALARRSGSSGMPPSALGRAAAKLLGIRLELPLANPRLEALRQFAARVARRGHALAQAELAAFLQAGFSPAHVRALIADAAPAPSLH
jgi:hypothetical protein